MAYDEQIGETADHPQAMGVLRQPAVAHLDQAEHPLDHADAVLDLGADGGLGAVLRPLHLVDDPALAGIEVRALPLYMRDPASTAEIARTAIELAAELRS